MTQPPPNHEYSDYLLGKLPPEQRAELERRLQNDPSMAAQLEGLRPEDDSFLRWLKQSLPSAEFQDDPFLREALANLLEAVTGDPADAGGVACLDDREGPGDSATPVHRGELETLQSLGDEDTSRSGHSGGGVPLKLERLGRYRMERVLGKGGMGAVYLAHDEQLDHRVALKVPFIDQSSSPEVVDRFKREARSAAALSHRNICPVFDVGEIDGQPYLTMAYVEGETLSAWVRKRRPVPEVLAVISKVARALHLAHQADVIHRDLKPANVMIDRQGEPVVMDFGLARRQTASEDQLTQTGQVMGTPAYMSPEQVGGRPGEMGPACDIYSLGVILYELLTGRRPFEGDDLISLVSQIALEPPPGLRTHNGEIDLDLEAIVIKALEKRPADRWASMADFADALDEFARAGHEGIAPQGHIARPASKATPVPHATAAGGRRMYGLGALLALAVLGGAGWLLGGMLLQIETPEGTLVLEVNQPDAEVRIVDARTGKVEILQRNQDERLTIQVDPGKKRLEVSKDGFQLYATEFQIGAAEETAIIARLVPRGQPVGPAAVGPPSGLFAADAEAFAAWKAHVAGLPPEEQVEAVTEKLRELNPKFDGEVRSHVQFQAVMGLGLRFEHVADISPVAALTKLKTLHADAGLTTGGILADLSPLAGLPIESLVLPDNPISDLSPLATMPLTKLDIHGTRVSDLSPLAGMPLQDLNIQYTGVSDLSALAEMPLELLIANHTKVSDLSPLAELPLETLQCSMTHVTDLSPIAKLPLRHLAIRHTGVTDLSPLKEMTSLRHLNLQQTPVTDLAPLKGLPLEELLLDWTKLNDLSALKGMPLKELTFQDTPVDDLAPLRGMPLTRLKGPVVPARDREILDSIETLTHINDLPVDEFWNQADQEPMSDAAGGP